MTEPVKLLLIFVNEPSTCGGSRSFRAVVHRLQRLNVHLFGIADDQPVTIIAVDDAAKIHAALPALREMVHEGLITLLDAEPIGGPPPQA